jgi:hypothetical protein
MAGYLNTFGARFQLDYWDKTVSELDLAHRIRSPVDLYAILFQCMSISTPQVPVNTQPHAEDEQPQNLRSNNNEP